MGGLYQGGGKDVIRPGYVGARFLTWKSFSYSSQDIGVGDISYIAGYYDAADAATTRTQAATSVDFGDTNHAHAAHAFIVAGGAGTTDGDDLVLTVSGTSITDNAVRTVNDSQVVVPDCRLATVNQYFETPKKWNGVTTFTLSSTNATTFSFQFNYGFCKYEDYGNRDFVVTDFEMVGLAGANDSDFDVELIHHTPDTPWTFAASGFIPKPQNGTICNLQEDHVTEYEMGNGHPFAYKRADLNFEVLGRRNNEGVIIIVTVNALKTVSYANAHIGVVI
jgi:hypothetical protein